MNIWIVMISLGLLTFLTRLSFMALLERFNIPKNFQRALEFVPTAVLSAIIATELVYSNNVLVISPGNPRLLAGVVATLVAYRTRNVVWTIVAGMAVFWILRIWL